jgi:hypothetical protein
MPITESVPAPPRVLSEQITLVYGDPKAGKSTLVAGLEGVCFLATEAGLKHLSAPRWSAADGRYVITSWPELLEATAEVLKSGKFKTIAIDTIGNACLLCEQYVCAKHGEEWKGDGKLGFGKGTALIVGELRRYLNKLSALKVGLVMIAHAERRTIDERTGKYEKAVPFLPGDNKKLELYNAVLGMADLVLYCAQEPNGKRVLRTKPHTTYDAGDRSGALPDPLPMASAALSTAFNSTNPA